MLGGGQSRIATSGGTAPVLDGTDWFLVKITAVTGTGATATYSFTEQMIEAHVGDVIDRGSPRMADKDTNPGRCVLASSTLAVDDVCLARRAVGSPNEWELLPIGAGGGSDWKTYKITARTGAVVPNTPPIYSGVEVELAADVDGGLGGNQLGWQNKSGGDSFTLGVRAPSKDRDEDRLAEILIPIPVGQVVLARPSTSLPGYYELSPWGGLKRSVIEHLYRVCAQCEDVGGGAS